MATKSRDLYKMEDTMKGDFSGPVKFSYCILIAYHCMLPSVKILFLGGLLLRDSNMDKKSDIKSCNCL